MRLRLQIFLKRLISARSRGFVNLALQLSGALLRYGLQLFLFRKLDLQGIATYNVTMVFITMATIYAGLEVHYVVNRRVMLNSDRVINNIAWRGVVACLIISVLAATQSMSSGGDRAAPWMWALLFGCAVSEYLNLELGRLSLALGRIKTAALCNIARSIGPYFLPVISQSYSMRTCLASLLIVSSGVFIVQGSLLSSHLRLSLGSFNSYIEEIKRAWPFAIVGIFEASLPYGERKVISHMFGAPALALFVVFLIVVSALSLIIDGYIIRANYSEMIIALSRKGELTRKLAAITLEIVVIALVGIALFITFGAQFVQLINKPSLALHREIVAPIMTVGVVKALWSLCFYAFYSQQAEKQFVLFSAGYNTLAVCALAGAGWVWRRLDIALAIEATVGLLMVVGAITWLKRNAKDRMNYTDVKSGKAVCPDENLASSDALNGL